jgi:hypothetical protein
MMQSRAVLYDTSCIIFYALVTKKRYLRTYEYVFSNGIEFNRARRS